jgi:hypothetical protein
MGIVAMVGHAAELNKIGSVLHGYDPYFVTAVSQLFVEYGIENKDSPVERDRVAFFGNLYLNAEEQATYAEEPALLQVRRAALARGIAHWDLPLYTAYLNAIGEMNEEGRSALKLDPDESFYWRFLQEELEMVGNGEYRFHILATCNQPVAFYGALRIPHPARSLPAGDGIYANRYLMADR